MFNFRFDTREDCERRCRTGPAPNPVPEQTTTVVSVSNLDNRIDASCDLIPKYSINFHCRKSKKLIMI